MPRLEPRGSRNGCELVYPRKILSYNLMVDIFNGNGMLRFSLSD